MPTGTLEVILGNAKGLEDQNWLTSMNPYVVITCRTQEKESSVASGEGSEPEWNETFLFTISQGVEEITLRIMDKDTFSSDDFVGEATISLHEVFREREVPTRSYNVVKDEEYCGEIKLGLTFTAESNSERGCDEEGYGGRRQSRDDYRGSDEDNNGGHRKSRDDFSGSDENNHGGHRKSRDNSIVEDNHGGRRKSRDDYNGSNEDNHSGRRKSCDDYSGSDDDNHGGRRKSRDNYSGSNEDNHSGRRKSREDYIGSNEYNYGGYRESRDDY
ncbi:elicitor-responsive protein 3-like [Nicotiana tomentosiformis]|uniref:elicitor-responsive protein 3-like n=1 Tax=Nicotiana tomentosiformis TaxID=4098 RepID=UPI00051C7421|nr:elicitor-responsive protein 3-like isoform X1 [Nicotiana tomentosiformis]